MAAPEDLEVVLDLPTRRTTRLYEHIGYGIARKLASLVEIPFWYESRFIFRLNKRQVFCVESFRSYTRLWPK